MAAVQPLRLISVVPAYKDVALTGVYEISKILTTPQSLDRCLGGVIAVLSSFMQMRRGYILLLDEAGEPELTAAMGDREVKSARSKLLVPQAVIDQIVATGVPLVIENISAHPLFTGSAYLRLATPRTTVSFIGVPIKADGNVKGVMTVDREWDGKLQFRLEDDVRLLTMVGNLVGQTLRMHMMLARDRDRLISETHRLEKQLSEVREAEASSSPAKSKSYAPAGIIGGGAAIRAVLERVDAAARSNATVLLRGETGTGKELFARAIHEASPRAKGPFVKVNCAALSESVLESELFGHEKGAFTGAINQRIGRFELAHGGTLFLDEIGEISSAFQAKLLRVLQEGEFERVGGAKTLKVDVRIVCATNRNLEEAVAKNQFRADLYYRLNVVTLLLPPLRQRVEDIPALARLFLERFASENGRNLQFSEKALEILSSCAFPGNVRELENCVRRTAALASASRIGAADFACQSGICLSRTLWKSHAPEPAMPDVRAVSDAHLFPIVSDGGESAPCPAPGACPVTHPHIGEKERLVDAMEKTGWVQAKAARLLGLTPRQIGYALRKHGVEMKHL
jgi:Nif-specific regulatory protein